MEHSPLEQFEIKRLFEIPIAGIDAAFTNSSAFMVVIVLAAWFFVSVGMRRASLVPGRWQSMVEMTYEFIAKMLHDSAGPQARAFFPFVFSLFMFVLFANLIGMIPYSFTVTSHIAVTFAMAFFIFIVVTVYGFVRNGLGYLRLFAPAGVPLVMLVILFPIEVVSYLIRPVTLSVRLFANMMAGHTILKVVAGFVLPLGLLGIGPIAFLIALTGLEVIVAILQAFVFSVLTCIYINDAIHPSH